MEESIIKILKFICQQIGITIDWASDQIQTNIVPYLQDLEQRIITYKINTSIFWMAIFGIAMVLCVIYFILSVKKGIYKLTEGVLEFIIGIVLFCTLIGFLYNSYQIITAKTLPEKVIMDYYKDFTKDK